MNRMNLKHFVVDFKAEFELTVSNESKFLGVVREGATPYIVTLVAPTERFTRYQVRTLIEGDELEDVDTWTYLGSACPPSMYEIAHHFFIKKIEN